MKKFAAVFVVAVLGPSLALAWLATRSLRDQELIARTQQALLQQDTTDDLAGDVQAYMDDVRVFFEGLVEEMAVEYDEEILRNEFDQLLRARWAQAKVGAVVTEDGIICSPLMTSKDRRVQTFLTENRLFLSNNGEATWYQAPPVLSGSVNVSPVNNDTWDERDAIEEVAAEAVPAPKPELRADDKFEQASAKPAAKKEPEPAYQQMKVSVSEGKLRSRYSNVPAPIQQQEEYRQMEANGGAIQLNADGLAKKEEPMADQAIEVTQVPNAPPAASPDPSQDLALEKPGAEPMSRMAIPQIPPQSFSSLRVNVGNLKEVVGDESAGALSRFDRDGLNVLLWVRNVNLPTLIFWVELDLEQIRDELAPIISDYSGLAGASLSRISRPDDPPAEVCLALLDAKGELVSSNVPGFQADWDHPFVSTEIGEILPHWEVAAYLMNPESISEAARNARLVLWLMVVVLIAAIAIGSAMICWDVGREMRLARQKTDFVSNVSHELKTPLTSIRMFSDLLSSDRPVEDKKRSEYAGIISTEAGRLSRLINNLLDFSRMERGEKRYQFEPVNVAELTRQTLDHFRPQLGVGKIRLTEKIEGDGYVVKGDPDALSQVLLNLLSNAEKYGGSGGQIEVEVKPDGSGPERVEVCVMDRGPGIARKDEERIFEKFYRVDDSLSSGIEGSGLGLTLARQIAQAHGGDVRHRRRDGGGCCFVLTLPLANNQAEETRYGSK